MTERRRTKVRRIVYYDSEDSHEEEESADDNLDRSSPDPIDLDIRENFHLRRYGKVCLLLYYIFLRL